MIKKFIQGKKIRHITLLALMVGAMAITGCTSDQAGAKELAGDIVAEINGETINKDELYETLVKQYGPQVLESLIMRKVIDSEIEKENIETSDEENEQLDENIEIMKDQYGGEDIFNMALTEAGLNEEELKKEMVNELKFSKLLESYIDISDEEISTYFEENKEMLGQQEEAKEVTLEELKEEIRDMLVEQQMGQAYQEWYEEKMAEYEIKNYLIEE